MTKKQSLTPTARRLLDEFDEAAKIWGWQQDQGYGLDVDIAERAYNEAKAALERYLARKAKTAK